METILGLDMGTASIGFALVQRLEDVEVGVEIKHMGVRIFPETLEAKSREPLNQARRTKRLTRRQVRRRKLRKRSLGVLLHDLGLLPPFGQAEWFQVMAENPYRLRDRGCHEKLTPWELGRVFYHLAKHRGFAGRDEGEESAKTAQKKAAEKEEGKIKDGIQKIASQLQGRTLGSFLNTCPTQRRRYIGREMVEQEFARLCEVQSDYHPEILTPEYIAQIHDILFFQRLTFWRSKTLGRCDLEPDQPLCSKGSWLGQRFILLQELNSLKLPGEQNRRLRADERGVILGLLERQMTVTFGAMRKAIKKELGHTLEGPFNYEEGGKKDLHGNAVEAALAHIFGQRWENLPSREGWRQNIHKDLELIHYRTVGGRIEILRGVRVQENRSRFIEKAQETHGVTEEEAQKLAELKLPSGWLRHSQVAVERMLPYLEAGHFYSEAMELAYPKGEVMASERVDVESLSAHPRIMPQTRNPSITRALNEVRKVVNNLIKVYGRPDRIRVELARDLKWSQQKISDYEKEQKRQEKKRSEAKKDLVEKNIPTHRREVEKWLLWKECQEQCPYTGKHIGFDDLFVRGLYEVEHIVPRSRSFNDAFANKTLCHVDENKYKGNRTPFECYGGDAEKWELMKKRVQELFVEPKSKSKARRFMMETTEEDDEVFTARQLVDTAYIARESVHFLARLGIPVETRNGRLTAMLRRYWGLGKLLNPESGSKVRDDHRHHAVDALVVALSSQSDVQKLSRLFALEKQGRGDEFPLHWPALREQAEEKLTQMVVSHRVRRKVSGALHEKTVLGRCHEVTEDGYTFFVSRKSLSSITHGQMMNIRDDGVRKAVEDHLQRHGGDFKKAFQGGSLPSLPSRQGVPQPIKKVRIWEKKKIKVMVKLPHDANAFAEAGENHHMAIFSVDGKKAYYETVSLFEAASRLSRGESVVKKTSDGGGRFLCSLAKGDMLEVTFPDKPTEYWIVRKISAAGRFFYKPHTMSGSPKPEVSENHAYLLKGTVRKVTVDPIGRVRKCCD